MDALSQFVCSLCGRRFNLEGRQPLIIKCCLNTACKECLETRMVSQPAQASAGTQASQRSAAKRAVKELVEEKEKDEENGGGDGEKAKGEAAKEDENAEEKPDNEKESPKKESEEPPAEDAVVEEKPKDEADAIEMELSQTKEENKEEPGVLITALEAPQEPQFECQFCHETTFPGSGVNRALLQMLEKALADQKLLVHCDTHPGMTAEYFVRSTNSLVC